MSHELTSSDGMFTTRLAAWHGLGTVFKDYPTRAEAQAIAHPWEPREEPVYVFDHHEEVTPDGEILVFDSYSEAEGYKAIRRSDDHTTLGVVGSTYTMVSNNELWDVAEALEGSGSDVMYETGGSLKGGSKVWILLRLQEPLLIKGDPRGETIPYYALQNSHDGSGSFRGQATMTRIVCANTARIADLDAKARGTEFTFRHTKNVSDRIEQARTALSNWRQGLQDWQDQMEHLVQQETPPGIASEFLERFIPMPPPALITERVQNNVIRDRKAWLDAYDGITGEGLKDTAYGLVTASIEFLEWGRRAFNAESRFTRSFLTRNQLVTHAVELALEATHADESLGSGKIDIL